MSADLESGPRSERLSLARVIQHGLPLAGLWAILGNGEGWVFGAPVILLASIVSCLLLPPMRLSLARLVGFAPYFAWNSVRAGVDVALLAVHPRMPIAPAMLRYELRLDDAVARIVMANVLTLLPGTLSVDLQGRVLFVHVLDAGGPYPEAFRQLEDRVARLFGPEDSRETT